MQFIWIDCLILFVDSQKVVDEGQIDLCQADKEPNHLDESLLLAPIVVDEDNVQADQPD